VGGPLFGAVLPDSFRPFPGAVVWETFFEIHPGRWCLATVTSVAGSTPARSASSGSSVGRAKSNMPSPPVPRPNNHPGRWRRQRILRERRMRVGIPPGAQVPVAQWQSVGKIPQPLVPRPELLLQALLKRRATITTLAGGVGNGYFGSGECGLESRRDCNSRGLMQDIRQCSVAACSPAQNLRLVRIEMQWS